jgi:hypothetical protein
MTLNEANSLLDAAPLSDKPSRINKGITQTQSIEIMRKGINSGPRALAADGINLDPLMEKRVRQVTLNRKRPSPSAIMNQDFCLTAVK